MKRLLITWLLVGVLTGPVWAQFGGGGGGGTGGAGDVGSMAASTATNPSTETQLKELALTAGALDTAGKKLLVHGSGRYTTAAAQTPTMRFRVYLCTVSGCGSGTVVTLADFTTAATTASTTNSWQINGSIGTITSGATGTVESKFWQQAQLGTAGDLTPETRLDQNNAASASIDLTGVLYVRTTVLMSTANAGNSVTQRSAWVDGGAGLGGGGGGGSSVGASGAVQTANGAGSFLDSGVTAVGGVVTGALTGNASTATALAANGANGAVGTGCRGVDASGAAEDCADFMEEPGSNGLVARTAANTAAARTVTGTSNQIGVTNGDGVSGNPTLALSSTLVIPGPSIEFTETAGDDTCAAGNYWIKANSTTSNFRKCQNGTATDLDTGGGGAIGGSTGATDNAIIRADGTGGATVQSSGCTISDANLLTCPGGFSSTGGTGIFTTTEGTAPGAPSGAGEHNIYFDSTDSKLKSHENGGAVVTYGRTADNLSAFAATTSAQLATVISDETGSGLAVFGTTPTLTTPVISGAISFPDGVTQTFNPNGTSAGLNIGSQAGLVGTPNNGDMWYDSTGNKYKCRENGVTVDCISTGAGSGDITDVVAGVGIAVATPGGPAPTVSWSPITYVDNFTFWDSANASRTITFGLSGATDPVITFSNNLVNVSTGALQVGGVAVATADSTTTFTNKTLDAEGTGNAITIPKRLWFPAAGVNNATAVSIWDLPTSNPAVAASKTGTNTQMGVLDFADAASLSAQVTYMLPATWVGNVDARVYWLTSATTGDVVWQIAIACAGDGDTDDPAFTDDVFTADTAKGTTLQLNITASNTVTTTGTCTADDLAHIRIKRDAGHASDTLAATARLIGVELVIREAM